MSDVTDTNPAADEQDTGTGTPEEAVQEQTGAPVFPVAAAPGTLVGEDTEVFEVESEVNDEPVEAQKMGEPAPRVTEVPVYEVSVVTDRRVDYVIIPPEGRGDATLPLHVFVDAKTPEQVFDEAAAAEDKA